MDPFLSDIKYFNTLLNGKFLVLVKYSGLNREASSVSGSENIFSEILVHSDNDNIFTTPSLIFEEYFNVYIIKHQYLLKKL